jgi:hypothetical protein
MTRKEFMRRMEELRAFGCWDIGSGPYTCNKVGGVSIQAKDNYSELFQNYHSKLVILDFTYCDDLTRERMRRSDKEIKQLRILAVLFWEQHVLTHKLYKDWE